MGCVYSRAPQFPLPVSSMNPRQFVSDFGARTSQTGYERVSCTKAYAWLLPAPSFLASLQIQIQLPLDVCIINNTTTVKSTLEHSQRRNPRRQGYYLARTGCQKSEQDGDPEGEKLWEIDLPRRWKQGVQGIHVYKPKAVERYFLFTLSCFWISSQTLTPTEHRITPIQEQT